MGLGFNYDYWNHLETPSFILCRVDKSRIGTLRCCERHFTYNNEVPQISFKMYRKIDGEFVEYYDNVLELQYIYLPNIGYFQITNLTISSTDEESEYKEIVAQSLEIELGQKYLNSLEINTGTDSSIDRVQLFDENYDPDIERYSLMHMILESAPSWTVGYVDPELKSQRRSFEIDNQDIYSFITGEMSQAFDCICTFNTINNTISIYKKDTISKNTNIVVSFKNILKQANIVPDIEKIKTCVTLVGEDENASIRSINFGMDKIYNFDYFTTLDYMSQELIDAIHNYKELYNSKNNQYMEEYDAYALALCVESYFENSMTPMKRKDTGEQISFPKGTGVSYSDLVDCYNDYLTNKINENIQDDAIEQGWDEKDKTYRLYYVNYTLDDFRRFSFTELGSQDDGASSNKAGTIIPSLKSSQNTGIEANPKWTDSETLSPYYNKINTAYDNAVIASNEKQEYLNIIKEEKKTHKNNMSALASEMNLQTFFKSINLWNSLTRFIREDTISDSNFLVTDSMSEEEILEMKQSFLDFGNTELQRVSQPEFSFSLDASNIFEFEEFRDNINDFDIYNYIHVLIRDDYYVKAKILSFDIDFEDRTNFSVTFGSIYKYKSKSIWDTTVEAVATANSAATSVSFNKFNWNNATNDAFNISKSLENGLINAGVSLNNSNSSMIVDERGLFMKSNLDGEEGYESALTGSQLVFTTDNWKTIRSALGHIDYTDWNGVQHNEYGLMADSVLAGYIQGTTVDGGTIRGSKIYGYDANKNVVFSVNHNDDGSMYSVKGTVGGWSLDTNKIYAGNNGSSDSASEDSITLQSNGRFDRAINGTTRGNLKFAIGGNFAVDKDGKLYCTSADISGNVTIGSGATIGGWSVASNSINNGSLYIESSGKIRYTKQSLSDGNAGLYIGTDGISLGASNAFAVTSAGSLTVNNAKIGGWNVSSNSISSGRMTLYSQENGSATFETEDTSGNKIRVVGGSISSSATVDGTSTPKWSVDANGNASFNSVSINTGGAVINSGGYNLGDGAITSSGINASIGIIGTGYNLYGYIDSISVGNINALNLSATYATIGSLNSANAEIGSLKTTVASLGTVVAKSITTDNLSSSISNLGVVVVQTLQVNNHMTSFQTVKDATGKTFHLLGYA